MAAAKKKSVAKKAAKKTANSKNSQAAKKPAAKKPAKKAAAKKSANSKNSPASTKAKPKTTAAAPYAAAPVPATLKPGIRRPDPSPLFPEESIEPTANFLNLVKTKLEEFAGHMRPLDRARVNGVGIRRQGFIERAYMLAAENPEFLPHWLTIEKFNDDYAHFVGLRGLFDLTRQIQELLWNLIMNSADMAYTDALEFYDSVRSAAKRRIDAAESIHTELAGFFAAKGKRSGEPTEKEMLRDMKALLKGRKDGKIILENIKPKVIAGKHKFIDEHYNDSAEFKETEEGSINK